MVLEEHWEGYPLSVLPALTTATYFPRHLKGVALDVQSTTTVKSGTKTQLCVPAAQAAASWEDAQTDVPLK